MKLDFETDNGIGTRATLGLIVLETDETVENEFRMMADLEGIALHHSRIAMVSEVQPETLARMLDDIPSSAQLLPSSLDFDVIGYGCTSASSVIGSDKVAQAVHATCPTAQVTDPLAALIAAGRHLGVKRLGFITPYVASVSAKMRERLQDAGFEISAFGSFEEGNDQIVARITPDSIIQACLRVMAQGTPEMQCDALVISCTNLRCLSIIPEIESRTGVPVLSSNQALGWHMLRLAGIRDSRRGLGRLFETP